MDFFHSGLGLYLQLVIIHSMVTLAVVAGVVRLWNLSAPSLRLRFYLLPIILPLLTPLIYPWLYPSWGSLSFRTMALFNSYLWLELRPWGQPLLAYLLLMVMGLSTALFLLQEVLPSLEWRRRRLPCQPSPAEAALVKTTISRLPTARLNPSISLNDSGQPLACIRGVRQPRLVLSLPLLKTLDSDEIEGIVAHELAHLKHHHQVAGWLLLLLRSVTFYNPVALLTSRWIIQEAEKECDALASTWTGKPLALASGLIRAFRESEPSRGDRGFLALLTALNRGLRRSLIEERVRRLLRNPGQDRVPYAWWRWGLTVAAVVGLLFMVV